MSLAKKIIPSLVFITPLVFFIGMYFFIINFYTVKSKTYFEEMKDIVQENYIQTKKLESEQRVKEIFALCNKEENQVVSIIKKELHSKVELAYNIAVVIHEKKKRRELKKTTKEEIKSVLSSITLNGKNNFIFITDYNANAIVKGSHLSMKNIAEYLDADYRSIILEEIQKVRRRGSGYLTSKRLDNGKKELIYVKDLGFYKWYIGSSKTLESETKVMKKNLLKEIESIPLQKCDFLTIVKGDTNLYTSASSFLEGDIKKEGWSKGDSQRDYFYVKYYKNFDWYIVSGFNISFMDINVEKRLKDIEQNLENDIEYINNVAKVFISFIGLFSFLFALKINQIFKNDTEALEDV